MRSPNNRGETAQDDTSRAWQLLVALVMETRGDWRRKVSEVAGLPFSRVRALYRLEDEARTLSELAYDMSTDAPAATVMINDLEARGLVERRSHPDDRRAKLVSLTPAGRKIVAAVHKIPDPAPAAFAALPIKDMAKLRNALEQPSADDLLSQQRRK